MQFLRELYLENFKVLRNNLILIQPLILFFIVLGLIFMPVGETIEVKTLIVVAVSSILMSIVFNAGWYYMIYKAVTAIPNPNLDNAERAIKTLELFKEFFPGVALYFFTLLTGAIIYFGFIGGVIALSYYYGIQHYGLPSNLNPDAFTKALESEATLNTYLTSLPEEWKSIVVGVILINYLFNFATMFWAQSAVYNNTGAFKGYLDSFKQIIRHPFRVFFLFLSYGVISQLALIAFAMPCIISKFIGMALYIVIIGYFNILLFLYLDKQHPHSCSRADCFR